MSPKYCDKHGWHDGSCAPGKHTITRIDLRRRIADIDAQLGDDETAQSNGYFRNSELQAERASLTVLAARMHG